MWCQWSRKLGEDIMWWRSGVSVVHLWWKQCWASFLTDEQCCVSHGHFILVSDSCFRLWDIDNVGKLPKTCCFDRRNTSGFVGRVIFFMRLRFKQRNPAVQHVTLGVHWLKSSECDVTEWDPRLEWGHPADIEMKCNIRQNVLGEKNQF